VNGWRFDPYSAVIGAALTLALVVLGYWFHQPFLRGWAKAREKVLDLVGQVTAGLEQRYRRAVVDWAQRSHALAMLGPLERLFLPPDLIPPPPPPDPHQDCSCVPLTLGMALRGHRRILVAGEMASGRTALLAYLALVHAREEAGSLLGLSGERLPLYVHLMDLDWSSPEEEGEAQESEGLDKLVRGGACAVGGPPAVGGVLRRHLEAGTALVLLDGWEELGRREQTQAARWLADLADSLPGNLWVAATGQRGYGLLADADFVPLRLGRWGRSQVEELLARCADLLSERRDEGETAEDEVQAGQPSLQRAADDLLQALEVEPSLLDLALRTWLLLDAGRSVEGRGELFAQALERSLAPSEEEMEWLPAAARATLGALAMMVQQEGRVAVARAEVEDAVEASLPLPGERPPRAASRLLQALTALDGILSPHGPGRYVFTHPLWRAYLVAQQMTALPPASLLEHLDDPRWRPVFGFFAQVGEMEPLVEAWLARPDDLWRTRLRTAARWAALAPADASWRNGVMALLARAFLDPALPTRVREQLAEALLRTGDPGLPVFMRQALQHRSEDVRVVAARVIGRLRGRADLAALAGALADPAEKVRTAAAFALGNVGTPAAIRHLTQALKEGGETLQVEAARGLAHAGEDGWQVLREAMAAEDLLVRRAAVYGLGEVKAPWSRELLEQAAREDDQWIVRSAAAALVETEAARLAPLAPPPVVSEMGWLITWMAERGEGVGMGEAAFGPLLRALEEGEPAIRRAAAQALGLVGRPQHADALRKAVDDSHSQVAQAALESLEELARRYDLFVQ